MSVIDQLKAAPEDFSFLQILRLLETHHAEGREDTREHRLATVAPAVDFRPPGQEAVRLRSQHSLSFPAAEATDLQYHNEQWTLQCNAFGLDGAVGPLPFHYTELLLERQKAKDPALARFLDLFNHRSASLYWRAASKYKLPLEYERARRHRGHGKTIDRHTEVLLSLLGLSPRLLRDSGELPAEALIYYGGLLSQQVKTASNLEQMVRGYFRVPAKVTEFSGTWCDVLPSMRCRLPTLTEPKGQNNCLGRSTLLGQKSWLAQNKVDLTIGPLDQTQYQRFAPGSRALKALNELSSLYLGVDNQFDITLDVKTSALPRDMALGGGAPSRLGWDSRLPQSIYRAPSSEETLKIPVSGSTGNDSSLNSTANGTDRDAA
ncbi:type VI secretion system baseplate subunit TssG [Marinimicrobium locisalis]|uniref:type VI secretion system baseplate subunit TssG n=1 Tax=Marinimicrobium locisalis TaxID=546022 RepID=UPI003221D3D3